MKNNKLKNSVHIYNLLGKGLFTCAVGILGLMLGGPLLAAVGLVVGIIGAQLLGRNILKLIKNN